MVHSIAEGERRPDGLGVDRAAENSTRERSIVLIMLRRGIAWTRADYRTYEAAQSRGEDG